MSLQKSIPKPQLSLDCQKIERVAILSLQLWYDALGQLETKTLAPDFSIPDDPTVTALQTLTYDYNIRGWLLGMNREYLTTEGQTNDYIKFGFELGYDKKTPMITCGMIQR